MFKQLKAAVKQARTPVSEPELLRVGFTRAGKAFTMADLEIIQAGSKFYYKSPAYKLTLIKSMYIVSQLVYGKIEYGK